MTESPHNSLDPEDWQALRAQGHRMLDDILDYAERIRERPVWQTIPDQVRSKFQSGVPTAPAELQEVHQQFMDNILPYSVGNSHPGFMGWVQGGGNPVGTLAEMLAAGLNANLGGRDHIPIEVERQITRWMSSLFHFPDTASGLFVTGTSMANFIAVLVARVRALGAEVRQQGLGAAPQKLVAYTSAGAHGCIAQAMDIAGLGRNALRVIPMNANFEMDTNQLQAAIEADRAAGQTPFMLVGTAGSVDVGAIDDLQGLADIASAEKLWFHIDGAFGAMGILSATVAPRLAGIECADSIAFDFHKWLQVPYDAGFILVRDSAAHYATFATPASYLRREDQGLAGGSPWPCDFGPDLSRGFRALKTWFTLQVYGTEHLGQMISHTCELGQYLKDRIQANPRLELLAPVALNIVCFRYRVDGLSAQACDALNARVVVLVQESGIAAPSTTIIREQLAIRAAIVNHRTTTADIDALLDITLSIAEQIHLSDDY
ncbi:pyridoxal phosphate-dependent decarboxylase family protein [Undibacterium sp. JH2W]|uniref:pyridoxal phosphate-dependent decarboxylase family protein n=1 Tax=Undibacterium sp. JH2W TaxID=3413037 RepID=UPI003BF12AB6